MKKNVDELKTHELNIIFGDLPEAEFKSLKEDISKRGMQSIIDVTEDNVIVCWHQRIRACKELGINEVEVRVLKDWKEDQVREHLIKDNVLRRQLTPSQVVRAGAELEKIYEGRQGGDRQTEKGKALGSNNPNAFEGRTRDLVAKSLNVTGRTYERYKKANTLVQTL